MWGDQFYARKERGGKVFSINGTLADRYEFHALKKPLPHLRLCDLTDPHTRAGVGIDSGTRFAPDLRVPRAWARVLALHPANLDGIVYRSRHTDLECVVLWSRPKGRRLDNELEVRPCRTFGKVRQRDAWHTTWDYVWPSCASDVGGRATTKSLPSMYERQGKERLRSLLPA